MRNSLKLETIFTITSIVLILLAFLFRSFLNNIGEVILFGLAFIIGGFYKAKQGIEDTIRDKALNVEILMILAAIGAFLLKNYAEGAILIFIFALSGLLENYANRKSEKALTNLLNLAPERAIIIRDGQEMEINAKDLTIGDTVVVKVGSQVPADGTIIQGTTTINESMITGEFIPVDKTIGDEVFAGTFNETSTFIMTVSKNMKESTVQKIIDFVKYAHSSQTKSETFIGRFEKIYVYVVIALAIVTMTFPHLLGFWTFFDAIYRGIVVLVVGSPCALVASVSPAILSSLSNASRSGVLIKGGNHLEVLTEIDTVILDKTGTITLGMPEVHDVYLQTDDAELIKSIIYSLEKQSNHPLAKAIVNHYHHRHELDIPSREIPGKGIEGIYEGSLYQVGKFDVHISKELNALIEQAHREGYTTVCVSKDKVLIGYISLIDRVRPGVRVTIKKLNDMNIKTIMMTGDQRYAAEKIAKKVGIKQVLSELLPEEKHNYVEALKKEGRTVMMVGDGINDAPALAVADIGVAMGSASDISLETSDMVIMNNSIQNIVRSIRLAKRMKRITLQNIFFSISVIVALLISNVFGLILLPLGVIAHEGSTILVILNSLRLLRK